MAGDWIKMRNNLWDDPRVSRLCDITDSSEAAIVGGLYWLWASADEHTEDGYMPGLSVTGIDRKTGIKGFGAALAAVGWLSDTDGGVTILNFEEHNGTSAKRRCTDAQRKANVRNVSASDADKTRTEDGQKAPILGAREEKNREEKKKDTEPSGFAEFWQEYPNHTAKQNAVKAWSKVPAELHPTIMAAVVVQKRSAAWTKDSGQFVPHAATWLNGKRWEDQQPANAASTSLFAGAL